MTTWLFALLALYLLGHALFLFVRARLEAKRRERLTEQLAALEDEHRALQAQRNPPN